MKRLIFLNVLLFSLFSCFGQENKTSKNSKSTSVQNTPHENWSVTEEYDDDGNLIARDSTYSYSYSTINGKEVPPEQLDSIVSRLNSQMRSLGEMDLSEFFQGFDSDFFSDSFFNDQFDFDFNFQNEEVRDFIRGEMEQFQKRFFEFQDQQRQRATEGKEKTEEQTPKTTDASLRKV